MSELDKLEAYLKEHGYKYERIDEENEHFPTISRHQIIVYDEDENRVFDAICNPGSYGFEEGLLEVMGSRVVRSDDSVEGWLTADEIIKRLEEGTT